KLRSSGLVRDAFVLHGALVAARGATDDEGDLWIAPEIVHLPVRVDGVEEDLEVVCHDDAHNGCLGTPGCRHRSLHNQRVLAHEAQQFGLCHPDLPLTLQTETLRAGAVSLTVRSGGKVLTDELRIDDVV